VAALVGRGTEQAELNGTWQAARGGQARVVGLAGPAGIGKTALVSTFLRDAAPQRRVWVSGVPEVDAGFGPGDANTQLVKVVYDEKTRAVLAAEAEVSAHPPDEATQRAIRAGGGLVVFR
jgi:predicted ATPase